MPPSRSAGGRRGIGGRAIGGQAARVKRTGIALVHEGELVLPAGGSEAAADIVASDDRVTVNYYFPVEVEVRVGDSNAGEAQSLVDNALRAFTRGVMDIG